MNLQSRFHLRATAEAEASGLRWSDGAQPVYEGPGFRLHYASADVALAKAVSPGRTSSKADAKAGADLQTGDVAAAADAELGEHTVVVGKADHIAAASTDVAR